MQHILRMAFIQSLSNLISHGINYKRDMEPSPYILSTSPPDSSMELYVLKHKLQVCTIPKISMKEFCHAIIKVALLPDSRPNFFSITETADEYTLIVTEDDFREFGNHKYLKCTGQLWRVLTVSVGAMGTGNEIVGVSKIAKSVIGPLADYEVSVLCMSTYQSDFILVEDSHLDDTIKCLGSFFKIFNEDHQRVNENPVLSSSPQSPSAGKIRPIKHVFSSPDAQFHITGLDASKLPSVMQLLLELIFFPSDLKKLALPSTALFSIQAIIHSKFPSISTTACDQCKFFHFSMVGGDISLMLDNDAMNKFPSNTLYTSKNDDLWRAMIIGDSPLGFECYQIAKDDDLALFYKRILSNVVIKQRIFTTEKIILGLVDFDKSFPALVGSNCCCVLTKECGIVAQVVEPLATSQISTYYVSTFNVEYCMVLEKDIDRVLKLLDGLRIENINNEVSEECCHNRKISIGSTEQPDEKERLGFCENLSLGEALQQSDNMQQLSTLSAYPQSPVSDDSSSYGASPPSDFDISGQQNNNLSNPIPIPPNESNTPNFSKLKC